MSVDPEGFFDIYNQHRSDADLSLTYRCPVYLMFFPLSPGAAGVLVGHPFDTVKVGVLLKL